MIPTPLSFKRATISNNFFVSFAFNADVGSSKISIFASNEIALHISTICCSPTGKFSTNSLESISTPTRFKSSSESA